MDYVIDEWTVRSRAKFKEKIKDNLNRRFEKIIYLIRNFLEESLPDLDVNLSLFSMSKSEMRLQQFYHKVDEWNGVDLTTVKDKHALANWTWKDYQKRADNWCVYISYMYTMITALKICLSSLYN